jgi:tetratricopeptide (TPR) repeat protein
VKEDAERNLDALIAAGGLGEELVGLTAAGGGLAAADLAELTGQSQRRIELVLGGSIGRAFQIRPTRYVTDSDGEPITVYSFAHQELLSSARQLLSPSALERYRDRLHAWVERAREAGWPSETPEWALTGYPRTLVELQDADRLIALATDSKRHERMWQVTGADLEALAEIADAFNVHGTRVRLDLSACVRLAHQRESLVEKTRNAPDGLIYAWASMGHLQRAAALAIHSAGSRRRLNFASDIIKAAGSTPEALDAAAEIIKSLDPYDKPFALAYLGKALTDAGDVEKATEIASQARQWALDIPNASRRDDAAMACANLMARSGREEEGADLARNLLDEGMHGEALGSVAGELAQIGKHSDAINLAREAILRADNFSGPDQAGYALCLASRALALAGQHDEAVDIVGQAVDLAANLERDEAEWLYRGASMALAQAGHASGAMDLIRTFDSDWERVHALGAVVEELTQTGKLREAAYFAQEAERIIFVANNPEDHQEALMAVVGEALAISGNVRRAYEIGRSLTSSSAIIAIADALAGCSQLDEAVELAQHAVDVSAAMLDIYRRAEALGQVSALLARCGRMQESSELAQYVADIARTKTYPTNHVARLLEVSAVLSSCGQVGEAVNLAEHAVEVADTIEDSMGRCEMLARSALLLSRLGRVLEATGIAKDVVRLAASNHKSVSLPSLLDAFEILTETEDFEEVAGNIKTLSDPPQRAAIDLEFSVRLLLKGRVEEAVGLARKAARSVPEHSLHFKAIESHRRIARALAEAGQLNEATAFIEELRDGNGYIELMSLAKHLRSIGRADDAVSCVRIAVSRARKSSRRLRFIGATYSEDQTLVEAAEILATVGDFNEAIDCAYAVPSLRYRIAGLLAVAEAGVGADQVKRSINLIKTSTSLALGIDDEYVKCRSLRSVVGTKARCGLAEEALSLADEITDSCQRSRGISAVALALAEIGQGERAAVLAQQSIDLLSGVHDPVKRAKAIRDACQVLALTAAPKEVIDTALSIEVHDQRCEALVSIAKTLARSEKAQDAIDAVLFIPEDDEQVSTFNEVAEILIAKGRVSELLHCVRMCADSFWLENTLPLAVESLRGSPDGGVLLAEALMVKSPTSLVSLISSFDIQAVKTFAGCLMSSVKLAAW